MVNKKTATTEAQKEKETRKFLHEELTDNIIGAAIDVHKALGPGFVEKIYQRALYLELKNRNIGCEREKSIRVYYKNTSLGYQTVDFVIEGKILVELKAVSQLNNIHQAQLLSYLKAANLRVGLLLNFAAPKLEIKRIAN